jgi:hypothetical protein
MPVTTGLVRIKPWGTPEWVTVRATSKPDRYRVVFDNKDLFEVSATTQPELEEKIIKAWREMFSNGK